MNHIHRAITILGIITSIGGLSPSVYAQPPQTLTQERSAEDFNKQGLEKYHDGDYQGAYKITIGQFVSIPTLPELM
jgi:hypothetical protein